MTINGDGSDDAILVTGQGFAAGTVEVFHDADGDATVDTSLGVFTGVNNIHISSRGGTTQLASPSSTSLATSPSTPPPE